MKHPFPMLVIGFLALVGCALDLARVLWLDVEILALYWVEPFLFGRGVGLILASADFRSLAPKSIFLRRSKA